MSPLPRPAKSSVLAPDMLPAPVRTARPPLSRQRPVAAPLHVPGPHPHVTPPVPHGGRIAAPLTVRPRPQVDLSWPSNFDEWMIDIVRRRALRLNSGARRRGVRGSVRAVELGHILARSADSSGRWLCALCREPVTLDDLSFDHVIALADGGEHASHNLVPAHRKCNEIKGSEKAQNRAHALDRWLNEWSSEHRGLTPRAAVRHAPHLPHAGQPVVAPLR
jgi:5-methylcytosine-specific restriction endonuclease McrA